jgi:hypothetical protein
MRLETMVAMAFGVLVVAVLHGDLWTVRRTNVLEIMCEPMSALDATNHCIKAANRGDTFSIAVNTSTQQVLFDVQPVQLQFRDWLQGTSLLENCRVVDDSNWECTRLDHLTDGEWVIRIGMMKGQFYIAQKGRGKLMVNSSGLSGWRYWAVYFGALGWQQAVKL